MKDKKKTEGVPVKTIWNSDGTEGPVLICAPTFEDIQAMAGFPVDREGFALTSDEDYGNRSAGEEAEEHDNAVSLSEAFGESDAERNL